MGCIATNSLAVIANVSSAASRSFFSSSVYPIRLSRRPKPFDSVDYIFELKIVGFRSLAYVETGPCDLVSRNGNTFRNFKALAEWIGVKAAMSCSIRSLTESLKFDHSTKERAASILVLTTPGQLSA